MMADIPSVSRTELAERRRQLRWQRRWRILQTSWQVVAVGGLAAGLVWVVSVPDWMLRDASQIEVEGNKFLSADTVRTLLPIKYPQFLLTLQPKTLIQRLESQAPIAEATVSRRLFPPGLTVRIQERYPVAIVFYASPTAQTASQTGATAPTPVSLLDERGTVIPYESYVSLNRSRQLPSLKIVGMQEQYRSQWASLYQQVSRSPVKVLEIDWREPGNLILHTELGKVYCGSYGSRFSHQLQTLDQMRQLSEKVDLAEIDFIDLRNPQVPLVELVGSGAIELSADQLAVDENMPDENMPDEQPQADPEINSPQ
ncbi:MAG: FtsQ-type POTRA domain-containing protein [Leptolyngbyaceae cyanobacterium CRU_2_3]|nr:FtsQ-type POTRA domain-containing protein [Leptolyngbyaceae cyanobacterium CRU_2_3]